MKTLMQVIVILALFPLALATCGSCAVCTAVVGNLPAEGSP